MVSKQYEAYSLHVDERLSPDLDDKMLTESVRKALGELFYRALS
jgi:hypothetical protein